MNRTIRPLALLSLGLALTLALPDTSDAGRRNRAAWKKANKSRKSAQAKIPAHPSQLQFAELTYEAPVRTEYRHELSNGVPVYVVPDRALPLVDIVVTARGGSYLDPDGHHGLAAATTNQMRDGGAGQLAPDAFDEEVDFLAINFSTSTGDRESRATMNLLSKDLDAGLDLLFAALREPRFDADRLALYQKRTLQGLERRNDSTTTIEGREWFRLMYGPDHFESAQTTGPSLQAIDTDDLRAFHRRLWHPGNLVVAVSGDVEAGDILPRLESRMAGWAVGEALAPVPPSTHRPQPGVFVVDKPDVNQTRVSIGHRSTTWDDPDAPVLEIANEILGGGGFTSRITRRVRSDEGLAYSAGSGWGAGRDYPRSFRAGFQSKNESVAHAVSIVLEELERIRTEPVSAEELETAVNSFVEGFPQRFSSATAKAATFATDEIWGRPPEYWSEYRPRMSKITAADVLRVAKKHLRPEAVTILVVGSVDEVLAGDPDEPEYRLDAFAGDRGVLAIPLPDPVTMQYPGPPQPLPTPAAAAAGMGG